MPNAHLRLLQGNNDFAEAVRREDPEFFERLATGQQPEFLWIGCADSRVPPTEVTGDKPGSIFVHRNIANVVVHTDANLLSVVYYAVKVLRVKHIIVCGHYGCGGVQAALSNQSYGFIDNWLRHIKDVYRLHQEELEGIAEIPQRFDRLVELNAIEQANNLAKLPFIQREWEQGQFPYIHAWVYDLNSGQIRQLDSLVNSARHISPVFVYQLNGQDG